MKLWGGRFEKSPDESLEEFGASIKFDHLLWQDDLLGSEMHVAGLAKAKVLTPEEAVTIRAGLHQIKAKLVKGELQFEIADEDVHMNIERFLHQEIGDLAGKVHTGRSRNDQVALDMRLFMRRNILDIIANVKTLAASLVQIAKEHVDTIIPGYTHLQRAQPVRMAHHWLAYVWMFLRDAKRLQQAYESTNKCPLGAGALAGSSFPVDQGYTAASMDFADVYENSIDAVSDRDYLVEFLSAASLIMMHLSKLSEELIMWSSQEFAFIELDDAFCTGSSMMPQKKNPDAAELIRGKTGRVYGALIGLLTTLKGLPLAYNKDLQEDKEGVFDVINTLNPCLTIMAKMIGTLQVNTESIYQQLPSGYLNATELANYLVKKGVTFRQAHELIGNIVKRCHANQEAITLNMLQEASPYFAEDAAKLLSLEQVVECYQSSSGSSRESVLQQINIAEARLKAL